MTNSLPRNNCSSCQRSFSLGDCHEGKDKDRQAGGLAAELTENFDGQLEQKSFETGIHKDPFDRMLIAQAQEESVPIYQQ